MTPRLLFIIFSVISVDTNPDAESGNDIIPIGSLVEKSEIDDSTRTTDKAIVLLFILFFLTTVESNIYDLRSSFRYGSHHLKPYSVIKRLRLLQFLIEKFAFIPFFPFS